MGMFSETVAAFEIEDESQRSLTMPLMLTIKDVTGLGSNTLTIFPKDPRTLNNLFVQCYEKEVASHCD